jgi:hypothetical protein
MNVLAARLRALSAMMLLLGLTAMPAGADQSLRSVSLRTVNGSIALSPANGR